MSKIVIVDVVVSFLVRYAIEQNDEDPKIFAEEEVVCDTNNNLKELSQKDLGDQIISSREVSEEEYLSLFDEDNDYLEEWSKEEKMRFINKPSSLKEYK